VPTNLHRCRSILWSAKMAKRFARIPLTAISCTEMSARDWRVFTCIALHADRFGRAYPSMATIAAITGIGRGDIPRSVRRLERLGLLCCNSRAGNSAVNVYTVIFDDAEVSASPPTDVSNNADRVSAAPLTGCQQIRTGGVSAVADQTNKRTDHRTYTRRTAPVRVPDSHDGASQFFAFWKAYPSRRPHGNPRKPAQQAFETAIKRGIDHAAIIRGAENYRTAVEREGTEPRYIPHAVTWLRQERWSDHREVPEPPRLRVGMI